MKLLHRFNVVGAGITLYAMNSLKAIAAQATVTVVEPPNNSAPVTNVSGALRLFDTISQWIASLFWIFAAIFIFYAAFLYLTGGGEEEKIKKANKQLIYAVIAIVVALFAYGLPRFIFTTLGTQ